MCRGTWPKQGKQTCLLLIFAVYLCALRIAREACACQRLHVICAKGVLPRVLCCYRTDHVVSAPVPSGTLFLLLVWHYFSFCFFRSSSTQGTKEVRIQQWRKLRSSCFPALPTGRVGEWCEGKRQQQAMTKMGVKVHLCQQRRWNVLCWDCLVSVGWTATLWRHLNHEQWLRERYYRW